MSVLYGAFDAQFEQGWKMNKEICEQCKDDCDIFLCRNNEVRIMHRNNNIDGLTAEYRADNWHCQFHDGKTEWCVCHWSESSQKHGRAMFSYLYKDETIFKEGCHYNGKNWFEKLKDFFWRVKEKIIWDKICKAKITRDDKWPDWYDCPYKLEHMISDWNRDNKDES